MVSGQHATRHHSKRAATMWQTLQKSLQLCRRARKYYEDRTAIRPYKTFGDMSKDGRFARNPLRALL